MSFCTMQGIYNGRVILSVASHDTILSILKRQRVGNSAIHTQRRVGMLIGVRTLSWAGKMIWVIGFSSQTLCKEGCQKQLLFTTSFIQQAFQ